METKVEEWLLVDGGKLHRASYRASKSIFDTEEKYRTACGREIYWWNRTGVPESGWNAPLAKNNEVIEYEGSICGNCFKRRRTIKVSAWGGVVQCE